MSHLVGNPEDPFSHNEAQIIMILSSNSLKFAANHLSKENNLDFLTRGCCMVEKVKKVSIFRKNKRFLTFQMKYFKMTQNVKKCKSAGSKHLNNAKNLLESKLKLFSITGPLPAMQNLRSRLFLYPPQKVVLGWYTVLSQSVLSICQHFRLLLKNLSSFCPVFIKFAAHYIRQCMMGRKKGAGGSASQELCHFVILM